MFWLLDLYFSRKSNFTRSKSFRKKDFYYDDSCLWIVFLPWKTSIEESNKYKLIPNSWDVIVYEWPYNLASQVPYDMPEAQSILANDILEYYKNNKNRFNKKIKILWISQWIYPAFYIANNIIKADKFIVITPAPYWEDAIWESKAVLWIKKKALEKGYTYELYKEILKEWNPWNNIKNLPDDIEIYYGRFDYFIMPFLTERLIIMLRQIWKEPKVFKNSYLWHFATILKFWKKLSKNKV